MGTQGPCGQGCQGTSTGVRDPGRQGGEGSPPAVLGSGGEGVPRLSSLLLFPPCCHPTSPPHLSPFQGCLRNTNFSGRLLPQMPRAQLGDRGLLSMGGPRGSGATHSKSPSVPPMGNDFPPREQSFALELLPWSLGLAEGLRTWGY